jgi:hypothetical protein
VLGFGPCKKTVLGPSLSDSVKQLLEMSHFALSVYPEILW